MLKLKMKSNTLLKITVILISFIFMLCNQLLNAQTMPADKDLPLLVLDEDIGTTLPKAFRTSQFSFPKTKSAPKNEGLANLNAAASAQFSTQSLKNALKMMSGTVWIIDLRRESHGFVNDLPISWYSAKNLSNVNESDDNILRLEQMLFADLKRIKAIIINKIIKKKDGVIEETEPLNITVNKAFPEISLANQLNLRYLRLAVLDHHPPEDATVDQFLDFVKTVPPEAWLYFHCRGGKGRSTTFMTMYDIIRNAHEVSLDDIVQRQALLGGTDLFEMSEDPDDVWKEDEMVARKNFITKFYKYIKSSSYPKKTWSEWSKNHSA